MAITNADNLFGINRFVVDPTPGRGGFTTIQSAIDAAALVAPATIYVNPGNYNENLTFGGIGNLSLIASNAAAQGQITVSGNHVFSDFLGHICFQEFNFNATTGDAFTITSTVNNSNSVDFENCNINANAGSAILATSTLAANFQVNIEGCQLNGDVNGILFNGSGGMSGRNNFINANSGACITVDNGAQGLFFFDIVNSNNNALVINSASSVLVFVHGGGSSAQEYIKFNAAGVCNFAFMGFQCASTSGFWVTGAGTLFFNGVIAIGSSNIDPAVTQATARIQPTATAGVTGSAIRGSCAFDSTSFSASADGFITFSGGAPITTLNGNTGSATGATITFSATNMGPTPSFVASGATVNLGIQDVNNNIILGLGNVTTSGNQNVVIGRDNAAVFTSAALNTLIGTGAGSGISTSIGNTSVGQSSLNIAGGDYNTCLGVQAMFNGGGPLVAPAYNLVAGYQAGGSMNASESSNIYLMNTGMAAENNTIRIGTQGAGNGQQNACYMAGIFGSTVVGSAVLCDSNGLLGTIVSSERYKDNIEDMAEYSSPLMGLRPVIFTYKADGSEGSGLIAEEVEQIMPQLVLRDQEGLPQSVLYHELPALLLNEIQKLSKRVAELEARLA